MPGFINNTMWADNVDFRGVQPVAPQIVLDGQLMIGATAAPHIRAATLTAGTGITITNGAGSITIAASGGTAINQINGDVGSVTGSTISFLGKATSGASVSFNGSSSTMTFNVSDASHNTLIGAAAGLGGTISGTNNTGLGYSVLNTLSSGVSNTIIGASAGSLLTTGSGNVAFGVNSLAGSASVTGSGNVAIGNSTILNATTATQNTACGAGALQFISTGTLNVALGYVAGSSYSTGSESSNIAILNTGTNGESHVIRIGTQGSGSGQQNQCFIAGIVGTTSTGTSVVVSSTGQLTEGGVANNPSQPAFSATQTTNQTNATGDGTTFNIPFDNELFDQDNNFASNTFTYPVDGKYHFDFTVSLANLGAAHTSMIITCAGTNLYRLNPFVLADSSGFLQVSGSLLISGIASATAVLQVTVSGGTKTVTVTGSAVPNYFSGYLVC